MGNTDIACLRMPPGHSKKDYSEADADEDGLITVDELVDWTLKD